jgi:hypothetical protein
MHFAFNNQFIKVTRTWPIFQKFQKNYFVFLISGIMNLYVKHTPDIALPHKIRTSLLRRAFLEP